MQAIIKQYTSFFLIKKYLPLFLELYPKRDRKYILVGLKELCKKHHYRLLVAFVDKKAIGILGLNKKFLLCSEQYMQISNFYIKLPFRKTGIAQDMLILAEKIAEKQKCKQIALYSYIDNTEAHKIYKKDRFKITSYYFSKQL